MAGIGDGKRFIFRGGIDPEFLTDGGAAISFSESTSTVSGLPHMKDSLPQYVTASAALAKGNRYTGAVPVAQFPRLTEALSGPATTLEVDLQLGRDAGHAGWLKGKLRAALPLTCQRCLAIFSWPLDARIELRLVASEAEEARLLNDCEPLLIEDDRLPLRQIVEDEALLAIPLAPRCDDPDCVVVFDAADSVVPKS